MAGKLRGQSKPGRERFQPTELTERVHTALRERLALPEQKRPSLTALAKQLGCTRQYLSQVNQQLAKELALAGDVEAIRDLIRAGDKKAVESYAAVVGKMAERAVKGDVKAARLVLDIVDKLRTPAQEEKPAEPEIVKIAMGWISEADAVGAIVDADDGPAQADITQLPQARGGEVDIAGQQQVIQGDSAAPTNVREINNFGAVESCKRVPRQRDEFAARTGGAGEFAAGDRVPAVVPDARGTTPDRAPEADARVGALPQDVPEARE